MPKERLLGKSYKRKSYIFAFGQKRKYLYSVEITKTGRKLKF